MYSCSKCEEKYTEKEQLSFHVEAEHQDRVIDNMNQFITCAADIESRRLLKEHIKIPSEEKYICSKCSKVFESESLLNSHMKIHKRQEFSCAKCDEKFVEERRLETHIKSQHVDNKNRQYNCEDCPFQGGNKIELKKHMKSTKHTPSEYVETCYSCGKDFPSYYHLMNHRKEVHPSQKICRYYLKGDCLYDPDECWYRHVSKTETETRPPVTSDCNRWDYEMSTKKKIEEHIKSVHDSFKCSKCEFKTEQEAELTNHMKDIHKNLDGIDEQSMNVEIMDMKVGFQEEQKKTPPDQMGLLIEIMRNMALQVKKMEVIFPNA